MNRLLYPLAFPGNTPAACPLPSSPAENLFAAWQLLPRWESFTAGLPSISPVMTVTRNTHAIMGGPATGPVLAGVRRDAVAELDLRYDFRHWQRGWFGNEELSGERMDAFSIADTAGLNFVKFILTEGHQVRPADILRRAFENGGMAWDSLEGVLHANHLDGACCQECEQRQTVEGAHHALWLEQFIRMIAETGGEMRVILPHPGCTTVRRFFPQRINRQGLWVCSAGAGASLFIRSSGVAAIRRRRVETDTGPQCTATLLDSLGDPVVTLITSSLPAFP